MGVNAATVVNAHAQLLKLQACYDAAINLDLLLQKQLPASSALEHVTTGTEA